MIFLEEISRENNVAVSAHELDDDFLGNIPEFVTAPDRNMDNSFHPHLLDVLDDAALAMLAQNHAKHRGFGRIQKGLLRQVHPGIRGVCG